MAIGKKTVSSSAPAVAGLLVGLLLVASLSSSVGAQPACSGRPSCAASPGECGKFNCAQVCARFIPGGPLRACCGGDGRCCCHA